MELHYECYGQGHPLIILHGLLGSADNWRTLSKALGQSFQVFALDQRNHGRSPHSEAFNYHVMVEDVREFMQQYQLHAACLLGHSMGGKVAMQFAVSFPNAVDQLIIVDIAPKVYPPGHDEVFAALYSLNLLTMRSRQEAETTLAQHLPDLALRQFLLKNLERDASGTFRWRINLDGIHKNYQAMLETFYPQGQFAKPTLFIRGANSDYIREDDVPTLRQIFPQAQIVTIPKAGHWVHAEAAQEFTQTVRNFLGNV